MELGLQGKRALVTGSSRGIGLAIAEGFLREGARVILTGRNESSLNSAHARLAESFVPNDILAHPCDLTDPHSVSILKGRILQRWGGLDILIANAGSGKSSPDAIAPREHFEAVFRENFDTAMNAAREFLPLVKESRGNMLFISSIAGMEAFGAPVDYSVAKTAVLSFAKNIARKLARDHVRVNCIAPGNVLFPGGSWDGKIKADADGVNKLIANSVPMNRFGTPQEIADAALFLCSERASFITGAVLCVDGGQTVTLF
jgi:3-oxoacyl-[acyl-carrier protein] reductase